MRSAAAALSLVFAGILAGSFASFAVGLGCALQDPPRPGVHPVYIRSVKLDPVTESPVVLLVERNGAQRELPIWVGLPQAESIALAIEDVALPRPNTHDLLLRLVEQMGGRVQRVVVTELRESTYYAVIEVEVNGRALAIDARPSDAIAVAVRGKVDIFASEEVLSSNTPASEDVRPLDVQWRAPDAQRRREFERVHETGSLPAI
jgi:uncharacterized protein